MDGERRDQDGLALLMNAGSLLGECPLCLCNHRITKRNPESFGGRAAIPRLEMSLYFFSANWGRYTGKRVRSR
jgi:hypothetical protein